MTPNIISNLITSHHLRGNYATLLLTNRVRPNVHKRHYELDNTGAITKMTTMNPSLGERNAFTGVYCFDSDFLRQNIPLIQLEEGQEGKTTHLFPKAFSECKLGGVIAPGHWYGINDRRELQIARESFPF